MCRGEVSVVPIDDVGDYGPGLELEPSGRSSRAMSESGDSVHSTRSLRSTDLTHVVENGRIYPNDTYFMPCDSLEQTRLEIMHRVFLAALNGALTTAPIGQGIKRILDVGTGPGEWASQMAERYPDAEVVAVDLAVWELPPGKSSRDDEDEDDDDDDDDDEDETPERDNIIWEIDDLEPPPLHSKATTPKKHPPDHELAQDLHSLSIDQGYASGSTNNTNPPSEPHSLSSAALSPTSSDYPLSLPLSDSDAPSTSPFPDLDTDHSSTPTNRDDNPTPSNWAFSHPFDLIHIRYMKGAFTSWDAVYAESHASLRPGGLLTVADLSLDTATLTPTSSLHHLLAAVHRAALRSGRPLTLSHLSRHRFLAAGFVDVQTRTEELPMGTWMQGERERVLGKMWLVACVEGVEAVALRLLTRWAGWGVEEVRRVVGEARAELLGGCHGGAVSRVVFVWARKGGGGGGRRGRGRGRRKRGGRAA